MKRVNIDPVSHWNYANGGKKKHKEILKRKAFNRQAKKKKKTKERRDFC